MSYVDKMVKPDWSNFPRHIEKDLDNVLLLTVLCFVRVRRDAGTRKGPGGQTLLKGTDKILSMLKSIPWNLEGQLHSSCAKFLPIIFLA